MGDNIFESDRILFFDGAMGTMIQAAGLKGQMLPELYNITDPEAVQAIHKLYIEAGSDIITTNTFNANRLKLDSTGFTTQQVVENAVHNARSAAGTEKLVALDIGPLGQLLAPMGNLTFDQAYDIFAEMVEAGRKAGADMVLVETMTDIYEARAAVLAARENTSLPVICTMTFQNNQKTMMGNDPISVVDILEGLGVDALGVNCSLGPRELIPIVEQLTGCTHLPVLVQPNAGLPELVDGNPVFPVGPQEFTSSVETMIDMGVSIIGGCCGTNPDYIRCLKASLGDREPAIPQNPRLTTAASSRERLVFGGGLRVIGKGMGSDSGQAEADFSCFFDQALELKQQGVDALAIKVSSERINESEMALEIIQSLQAALPMPILIDSTDPEVLERGARIYNGKAVIGPAGSCLESAEKVFSTAQRYGGLVVIKTFDNNRLPVKAEDRYRIAVKLMEVAAGYGLGAEDLLIDCLGLTSEAGEFEAQQALEALRMVKTNTDTRTLINVDDNILKLRSGELTSSAFLSTALIYGLDAVCIDPRCPDMVEMVKSIGD